ncbi:MAG: transcription-repair coupling factor [Gammaproteobacteria bacterium]|nr:MAG: transcription-repair coupling factor [Gammaproteobacteria bacterium]
MALPDHTLSEPVSALLGPVLPATAHAVGWRDLYGSSSALALIEAARQHPGPLLVVLSSARRLQQLVDEIHFYQSGATAVPVLLYPDWECLPYDAMSPHSGIISQRLSTLQQLPELPSGIVLTTAATLMHRTPPRQYIAGHCFSLAKEDAIDITAFRSRLHEAGYHAVSQVMEPGEFAVRGGLFDLFPVGSVQPFRLDFFDDRIESIRVFDPESQRSTQEIDHIHILPAREFPLNEEGIRCFRQSFRAAFEGDPQKISLYQQVSDGLCPAGSEYYLPLFFGNTETLFDYLPQQTLCVADADCLDVAAQFSFDTAGRYEQMHYDSERPILPPRRLFIDSKELYESLSEHALVVLSQSDAADIKEPLPCTSICNLPVKAPPDLAIEQQQERPYLKLVSFLQEDKGRHLLVAESPGRRETLCGILNEYRLYPERLDHFSTFLQHEHQLAIIVAPLEKGLSLSDASIQIITETQLYGERAHQQRRRKQRYRDSEFVIRNLSEMHIGDAVVHDEHGVGRYLGLKKIDIGDGTTEFMLLQYAGGDKLYIPVTSLHLISRYTGANPEHAPLHKLGGESWAKARKKAREKAHDAAVELLELAALRESHEGIGYKLDTQQYTAFTNSFPFEETPDQERAIDEVIEDMLLKKPMDRLVCGDVGFGKTEVALRAAFIATQNEKQVAVLVPTTLLAQQHYQNFMDRFADFPIKIGLLSRFKSKKEQQKTLGSLNSGTVDIVIGTHRLLQEDINFSSLGLVIIDEEHRFGVRQKEQLKKMRSKVDILTLTATPIPRTLNMAMTDLRKISIIATPPQERMSIKTMVSEWNNGLLREACLREIRRGGQVYFLHNDVKSMPRMLEKLQGLVPEADIHMAHGQMPERELEHVMLDFYHQRFNILLCSTIIESGIDIPTANTIIIERADKFGLAQLHQLRGRVGRSHHQAYAYLITPPRKTLSDDAKKRIDAIQSLEELGSGFILASHDLEIRGAGELLGESQSGEIDEVGFTMYLELLQKAIQSLRGELSEKPALDDSVVSEVNIHAPALLSDDYIPDIQLRLMTYKRIANATNIDELTQLKEEIIDRFGLLNDAGKLLFDVTRLKLRASAFDIRKIDAGTRGIKFEFSDTPCIDAGLLLQLIQQESDTYKLEGPNCLRISREHKDVAQRVGAIDRFIQILEDHPR